MKRSYILMFLSFMLLLALGPSLGHAQTEDSDQSDDDKEADDISNMLDDMSLEEKVGQLFIIHAYGKTPTDEDYEDTNLENNRGGKNFKEIIETYHIGGIIYFNWSDNIGTPVDVDQVNALSNGLQEIAMDQDNALPLIISTDQEGGIVQRVESPGTVFPGNMALGATASDDYAFETARILGNELQSLGINTDFAPSLDVNMNANNPVIGVRSFGEDPDLVSDLGIAQIRGFQDENVIASAKHFPGHGDTETDSHTGLPVIDHDLETLHEIDLKPFKDAIDEGIDSIMTAHIEVPAVDESGLPATLSKPILTDLLREEMDYDGLVITDSLDMEAVNDIYPPEEVSVEALKAGADILLNPPDVTAAYEGVLEAVQSGEISEARLDESVSRILAEKMDKDLFDAPYTDPEDVDNVGTEEHLQTAADIAEKSITLVQNEDNLLPLKSETDGSILITGPEQAQPGELAAEMSNKDFDVSDFETATSPSDDEIENAVQKAESADKVIVTTYTANTNTAQQKLVKELEKVDVPVIVAALGNPYDLESFPDVEAYLNTYSYLDVSIPALANTISGEANPFGMLPVTIPDSYEMGHGLDYIDTPLSGEGMKTLVAELDEDGELNDAIVHDLTLHLTAVAHFEEAGKRDKVIKHMEGFMNLVDVRRDDDMLTHKAHSYLETEAEKLIRDWEAK